MMGQAISCFTCSNDGNALITAAANGDAPLVKQLLAKYPKIASYHHYQDRTSALIQASARGHSELVQMLVEAAVMCDGVEKAKRNCIDHTNNKRQTALIVACKHGHSECVEYLATNGADPLVTDERRHNTCLHFAALYGNSECAHKLLASKAGNLNSLGSQMLVAQLMCPDEDEVTQRPPTQVKFIDRHNGWGLTALHIAVFQGSISTVRALLRHGADLQATIAPSKVENSPIRCAIASNVLHIAAITSNNIMAKMLLEAQEGHPGLELRSRTNSSGLLPQEYAARARNSVLVHLLDERLPVSLLRQIWANNSLDQSTPARHTTLASLLQKLKLMFNLEIIAIQRNVALSAAAVEAAAAAALNPGGTPTAAAMLVSGPSGRTRSKPGLEAATVALAAASPSVVAAAGRLWAKRLEDVQVLLSTVTVLSDGLALVAHPPASTEHGAHHTVASEAVLDFLLSTLITPRTVSAVMHAAKKLASTSGAGGGLHAEAPVIDAESQHHVALLTTTMRAVATCLHAATHLTSSSMLKDAAGALAAANSAAANAGTATAAAVAAIGTSAAASTASMAAVASAAAAAAAAVSLEAARLCSSNGADTALPTLTEHSGAVTSAGAATPAVVPAAGSGKPTVLSIAAFTSSTSAAHWSAHLHTLIAQLQWDIGVQRHRRRRAHAAAAAARSLSIVAAAVLALPCSVVTPGSEATPVAGSGEPMSNPAIDPSQVAAPAVVIIQTTPEVMSNAQNPTSHTSSLACAEVCSSSILPSPFIAADAARVVAAAATPNTSLPLTSTSDSREHTSSPGDSLLVLQNMWQVPRTSASSQHLQPNLVPQLPGALTPDPVAGDIAVAGDISAVGSASSSPVISRSPSLNFHTDLHPRGMHVNTLPRPTSSSTLLQQQQSDTESRGFRMSEATTGDVMTSTTQFQIGPEEDDSPSNSPCGTSLRPRSLHCAFAGFRQGSIGSGSVPGLLRGQRGSSSLAISSAALQAGGMGSAEVNKKTGPEGGLSGDNSPARSESGSEWSEDDSNVCSICMDLPVAVLVASCRHGLCVQCAFQLCTKGRELPCCPFCRCKIAGFVQVEDAVLTLDSQPTPLAAVMAVSPRASILTLPERASVVLRRVISLAPGAPDTLVLAV